MCDISGLAPAEVFAPPARGRARLDAGHGRRGAPRRRARADLARTSCPSRAGSRSSRPPTRAGPALDRDGDVRPHRGAVGARRAHARRARAAGAHRRHHRVRAALVHPLPDAARPHPRRRGDLAARRTSSTPPSSASRSGERSRNLQASWVKMGLDAATESLRWGVNDLGGTLMEESISRMAGSYHGTRLDPEQLVAAAHAAGRPAAERTTLYEIRRRYPSSSRAAGRSPLGRRPPSDQALAADELAVEAERDVVGDLGPGDLGQVDSRPGRAGTSGAGRSVQDDREQDARRPRPSAPGARRTPARPGSSPARTRRSSAPRGRP